MKKNIQKIEGNNNIQIGVNHGDIIYAEKIIKKTEAIPDPNIHISEEQAFKIQEKVNELVTLMSLVEDASKKVLYTKAYGEFKHYFHITGYKFLPKDKFDEAMRWFDQQKVLKYRPKLKKVDNKIYRNLYYKSIHSKATELNWNHDTLYQFINQTLCLKTPISSIKELSDTMLKKIYEVLFRQRIK